MILLSLSPRFFGLLLFSIFLSGCATHITTDYDRGVDFSEYRTFQMVPREERAAHGSAVFSELVDRRIENAISATLQEQGLKATADNPNLRVHFFTLTRTRTELIERGPPRRYSLRDRRDLYYVDRFHDLELTEYDEGTLVIDLVDTSRNHLVWRGTYTRRVGWTAPDDAQVKTMVGKIFRNFP